MSNKLKAILSTFVIFGSMPLMYIFWSDTLMYILIGIYAAFVTLIMVALVYKIIKDALDRKHN